MTKSPGEKHLYETNKEQPAQLPHDCGYNFDCHLSNMQIAIYNDSVPNLHMCSQISVTKQDNCETIRMNFYILQYTVQAQSYLE